MINFPLVAPRTRPPVPNMWQRTRHALIMADGSTWEISNPASGVFLTKDGLVGMERPAWERFSSTSSLVPGSRFYGSRAPERDVVLPLYLYSDASSQQWVEHYRAFMRYMRPDVPMQWVVTQPETGESRTLLIRFEDPGDQSAVRDHRYFGWKRMNLHFVADERPFWEGQPITREWSNETPTDFTGPSDAAPDFYISGASFIGSATIANPGDETAWWVAEAFGAFTSVTVGVSGRVVTAPLTIAAGKSLRIDSRPGPRGKSAYDSDGVRRTGQLTPRQWAPIPPGAEVPLDISMTGSGRMRVTLTPLYHEAI